MRKQKQLGVEADKKVVKEWEKILADSDFRKRLLVTQFYRNKIYRLLNFEDDDNLWLVNLDGELLLYNSTTKKLLSYGHYNDKDNPCKIASSKDVPWDEVREAPAKKKIEKETKTNEKQNTDSTKRKRSTRSTKTQSD